MWKKIGLVQKAICSGFFRNAAKRDPQEGYLDINWNKMFYHVGKNIS